MATTDDDPDSVVQKLAAVLSEPIKNRGPGELNKLVRLVKNLPFFRDRGLVDSAI